MNPSVAAILGGAAFMFLIGAWVLPDADLIRLLGFWSLAMSAQIVVVSARAVWVAIHQRKLPPSAAFLVGLLIVNLALVFQRLLGIAVRDFAQGWLVTSDIFSLTIAMMIVGQALKFAAIEQVPGTPVSSAAVGRGLLWSLLIGAGLYLVVSARG